MKVSRIFLVLGLCGLAGLVHKLQASQPDPVQRAQTTYYATGQIRTEGYYRDGRRDGPSQAYYADGRKMAEGKYEDGQMSGSWSFWLPNGELDPERSGQYSSGVRTLP